MRAFLITAVCAFLLYLLLTTASGYLFLWSKEELIIGAILAAIVGAVVKNRLIKRSSRMLNSKRWLLFIAYLVGPFF